MGLHVHRLQENDMDDKGEDAAATKIQANYKGYRTRQQLKEKQDQVKKIIPRGINLFTTIHDGNFRRHSSMNVTIQWHKFSSNIYYIYVFFVIWSWKLR